MEKVKVEIYGLLLRTMQKYLIFFFIYFFSLMAEKQQQFSKSLNHPDTECKVHVCLFL